MQSPRKRASPDDLGRNRSAQPGDRQPVFVYGSHLWFPRFRYTCHSATLDNCAVARLEGYRVTFDKRSLKFGGSGKATIAASPGDHAWGVVYWVHPEDRVCLDIEEGVPSNRRADWGKEVAIDQVPTLSERTYIPTTVSVAIANGEVLHPRAYVATAKAREGSEAPFDWYRCLVVEGARKWGIPEEYIRRIEDVAVKVDSDPQQDSPDKGAYWLRMEWSPRPPTQSQKAPSPPHITSKGE